MSFQSHKHFGAFMGAVMAVSVFFFVTSFGMHVGMMKEGNMSSCPLMGGASSMCQTDVAEHISIWEATFSIPVSKTALLILSSLLVLLLLFPKYPRARSRIRLKSISLGLIRARIFKVFDYLASLFSRGVLHPKLYTFVSLPL